MSDSKILDAVLRTDLASFIRQAFHSVAPGEEYLDNWHIWAIAWHLQQCADGKIRRLLITLPPRHLKSIAVSVAFPAWLLGRDPTQKIVCVSYSQDLAAKHAIDCRAVMESPRYLSCFPNSRLHSDRNAVQEMMTTKRGYRLATSVGGTLTGRGGAFFLIDDPHKADEAQSDSRREATISWFRNTLLSRLNNKERDVIVIVQQRLHENDLAGYVLETGDWTHLDLPAIAEVDQRVPTAVDQVHFRKTGDVLHPEREPRHILEAYRRTMGSYTFAAQYQQRPAPQGGGLVKWAWFKSYESQPPRLSGDQVVQSWDTASKAEASNDWSVCTTWLVRENTYYLLNLSRDRLEFPALKRRILDQAQYASADLVLIEDQGAGTALLQDIRRDGRVSVVGVKPKDDKATRLMAVTPVIEGGNVYLPKEAHWLAELQREIVTFPRGKHDDQVDSLSQFLSWAREHQCDSGGIAWAGEDMMSASDEGMLTRDW